MTIKAIRLNFENCEICEIDIRNIGIFIVEDIHTKIHRLALNAVDKMSVSDTFAVEIFKEGNTEFVFQEDGNEKNTIFNRITEFNDITFITLIYDDDTEEDIFINYREEDDNCLEMPNLNQKNYLSKLGNLYIVISENKEIDDFFNKEEIDKEEYAEYIDLIRDWD